MILFSSDFSAFSISAADQVSVTMTVSDATSSELIFTNTYLLSDAGSSCMAEIFGIGRVINSYLYDKGWFHRSLRISFSSPVTVSAIDGSGYLDIADVALIEADVIFSSLPAPLPAEEFLRSRFLIDQSSFTVPASDSALALALGDLSDLTFPKLTVFAENGNCNIVSSLFSENSRPRTSGLPVVSGWSGYTVSQRSEGVRTYSLPEGNSDSPVTVRFADIPLSGMGIFRFRNSFNILEPMLLQGVLAVSPDADAQSAYVSGRLRRFDCRDSSSFTFEASGLSSARAAEISRALLMSPEVSFFSFSGLAGMRSPALMKRALPVIIDSVDGEISDSPDSLSSVKIKFRLS